MACADQQMMPGGTAPSAPMAAMAPCFMTQVEMPMAGMMCGCMGCGMVNGFPASYGCCNGSCGSCYGCGSCAGYGCGQMPFVVTGGSSASTAVPDGGQSSTSWSGWSEWTPNHWDWSTDATSGNMQTQNGNWKEERPKVGFKTKICGYYVEGSCPKGADCTFAHGAHELHLGGQRHDRHEDSQGEREVPNGKGRKGERFKDPETKKGDAAKVSDQSKAQTEGKDAEKRMKPCVYFAKGSCNKGAECNYQHEEPKGESKGKGDRSKGKSKGKGKNGFGKGGWFFGPIKTKLCANFLEGSCSRGTHCSFAHGPRELGCPVGF
ncbi:unnamed protein product [Durusdinium trenchii]|uniref:C3H1-type domain-containing protein n=1 Tax=Durusdinium trenchii TaxID=1381693 RepID=A0ABP0LEV8_9DINO